MRGFDAFSLREPLSTSLDNAVRRAPLKKSRPRRRPGVWRPRRFLLLSEVIIDARADHSETVTVRHAGDGEVAIGEIDVKIFDLGAPVLRETEFGAGADGPAGIGVG